MRHLQSRTADPSATAATKSPLCTEENARAADYIASGIGRLQVGRTRRALRRSISSARRSPAQSQGGRRRWAQLGSTSGRVPRYATATPCAKGATNPTAIRAVIRIISSPTCYDCATIISNPTCIPLATIISSPTCYDDQSVPKEDSAPKCPCMPSAVTVQNRSNSTADVFVTRSVLITQYSIRGL